MDCADLIAIMIDENVVLQRPFADKGRILIRELSVAEYPVSFLENGALDERFENSEVEAEKVFQVGVFPLYL